MEDFAEGTLGVRILDDDDRSGWIAEHMVARRDWPHLAHFGWFSRRFFRSLISDRYFGK